MGVLAICSPVSAQPYPHQTGAQVDVGIFYDSLSPYGDWLEMPDYGWSWAPRVDRGWRPYTRGQWIMTDDGWYWDSDEHFGWAAYHYGRWINHPYYGWIWIPGTEWAPAWVSWRHGNGYTGWAPLPPRATWQAHVGLNIGGLDIDAFIGANDYAFVPNRSFVDHGIYQRVLPPTQNVTIINVTNNVTNYTVVNQRVFNGGIAVANVEKAVGRRVLRARTIDVDRAGGPKRVKPDEIAVFRPRVTVAAGKKPAHGKSLVKGDAPPARLAEHRKEREQERRQKGNQAELTAKDVQKQPPALATREVKIPQQDAQRQRDQARQDAAKQKAKEQAKQQDQQRLEREKSQAIDRQQRDQARQDAVKQKAKEQAKQQDPQRLEREKHPVNDKPKLDPQREKQDSDAQAQADKRAKDAREARQNAKEKARNKGKNKGKKDPNASPTPPPEGDKE
jgi:hypothetical protein